MHQACSLQLQHAVHAVMQVYALHKPSSNQRQCCMCRFNRLATGPGGTVSIAQVQSLVELGANPFIPRIFQVSS